MRIAPGSRQEADASAPARAGLHLLPTLAMPGLFYFLFEGPDTDERLVTFLMASYAMWAILGVAFFQFGVGIAEERTTAWERFLPLPLSAVQRLAGRVLSAALFAAAAAAVVIAEAHLINPVRVPADQWLPWLGALGAGGVVMALGGIAIGYWASPRAATALATLAWLLLAYLGGLANPQRASQLGRRGLPVPAHPAVGRADLGGGAGPGHLAGGLAGPGGLGGGIPSWPGGATGATRRQLPLKTRAVRSHWLRRPTTGGDMERPSERRAATANSMAIGFCGHRRHPVPPSPTCSGSDADHEVATRESYSQSPPRPYHAAGTPEAGQPLRSASISNHPL